MKKLTWVALALSAMMMSSCVVSRKKFEQSENARWRAYYTRDSLANLLDESRAQCAAFDQRCGLLMSDTALLKKSIRNYQSMLANNQSENKKLNSSLAQKIKEIARENDVEIVENKPLARMLYANVDIGGLIPPELYQSVAEVLAFVYHLKGKA